MSTKTTRRLTTAPDALSKLLPPSEVEIMRILWTDGPQKVRPVHRRIAAERGIAYTTTQTTMERLAEKGLLHRGTRQGTGGAYVYSPAIGEQEFVAQPLADILSAVERNEPAALASYLDTRWPAS